MNKKLFDFGRLNLKTYMFLVNTSVFMIHAILLVSFIISEVYIMAYINIVSVTFYALSYLLINNHKFYLYITLAYTEIWVHMIFAVTLLGWSVGFQYYCFILIPMIFFAVYIGMSKRRSLAVPITASLLDIIAFIFCYFYTKNNDPYYLNILSNNETTYFYCLNIAIVFFGLVANTSFFVGHAVSSEQELQKQAEFDELTGLNNRRYIRNVLDDVYYDYVSNGKLFSVAITDIDDFKNVNDTFGHDAGDYVLRAMGKTFLEGLPENASLGRWGGEEFIVIFRNDNKFDDSCRTMEQIRSTIENNPYVYDGHDICITLTVGVAQYEEGMSITDIIRRADARMYQGKTDGKNTTICR